MPAVIPLAVAAIGAGASMSSANTANKSAKSIAEQQSNIAGRQAQTAMEQGEEVKAEAKKAAESIKLAGQATPEENQRLARYNTKATTPAETLMTESGPIAQAVARRVQERVDQPGLDYDTNSQAFTEGVGNPLWASLKARGIAAPPGSEGGGLGTQQYMKGAEPALAQLRSNQINTDISRGEEYGTEARGYKSSYEDLENILAEAIRNRLYQGEVTGAQTGLAGLESGAGITAQGSNSASNAQSLLQQQLLKSAMESESSSGTALANILSALLKSQGTTGTTTKATTPTLYDSLSNYQNQSPYSRQLAQLTYSK